MPLCACYTGQESPASSKILQLKLASKCSYFSKRTTTTDMCCSQNEWLGRQPNMALCLFQEMELSFPNDYQPLESMQG